MKVRVLFAAAGIPVLLAVIFFLPLYIFAALVAAISALSAVELLRGADPGVKKRFLVYAAVTAAALPVLASLFSSPAVYLGPALALFAVLSAELILSLTVGAPLSLSQAALTFFAGFALPLFLSSLVRLGQREYGPIHILLAFAVTFSCDSGAYFIGTFFGRIKMAPRVSPNKTIEGAAGGFLASVAVLLLYGLALRLYGLEVNLLVMAVYGFLGALLCQFGDLTFSAVKRVCGVKDFGSVIPGSGGMLDRFDSIHLVAPLIELLVLWVPAVILS